MPQPNGCPQGRSQEFTFPRRELLQRLASAALLYLLPYRQLVAQPLDRPATTPRLNEPVAPTLDERALPEFKIGDLISCDWTSSEFCEDYTEFGEIVGACRLPDEGWVYYINWTHGTGLDDFQYPCFETEPTTAERLRLVSHG